MEQAPDSMELKVISCKDLKAFNFFQKLNIYVVVSIVNEDDDDDSTPSPTNNNNNNNNNNNKKKKKQQQRQKTPIDREGDGNPEWNHLMRFDLKDIFSSSSSLLLQFDLLSEGTILGDKTIGRVRVPFQDLINEFNGGGAVRFVSYQVRTTDGIPNGVLDFSFKPIFIHNPNNTSSSSNYHHHHNPNKFGNESAPPPLPIGGNTNVPLIYPPMPSTNNYYPPPPPPPPPPLLPVDHPFSSSETHHNPESYYPKIDQFHNPSQQIHYPTILETHSPPSEFHNPSHPEVYYYPQPKQHPQPQPQVDYHQLPSSPCYHHHHDPLPQPQPQPQVAYYPPTAPPLFYPPTTNHPYGHEFGNPNPVAYDGYPNYWASTQPIHW